MAAAAAAAAGIKAFSALVFVLLICTQGYAYKCSVSHIKVKTIRTGSTIEGQPQFQVIITNDCPCAQSSVYLRCLGFSTVQPINPGVLSVKGDSCLINNGRPIVKGKPVIFKYSFLQPTDLIPQSSKISC